MSLPSSLRHSLALAAALVSATATARAQQGAQLLYEWQGRVDHEVQIAPGGRNGYSVRGIGGQENPGRFRSAGGAPRGPGQLSVQKLSGRGPVDMIGNDVVRIRDPQGGADVYRVRVYWQSSGGGYGRRDRQNQDQNGNDRRRPNDDRRPRPY